MTPAPGVQARPRPCCAVLGMWRLLFRPFAIVLPLLLLLLTSPARVANPACWARHPQHGRAVARPPLAQCHAHVRVAPRETAGRVVTWRARLARRPLSPPPQHSPLPCVSLRLVPDAGSLFQHVFLPLNTKLVRHHHQVNYGDPGAPTWPLGRADRGLAVLWAAAACLPGEGANESPL